MTTLERPGRLAVTLSSIALCLDIGLIPMKDSAPKTTSIVAISLVSAVCLALIGSWLDRVVRRLRRRWSWA